MNIQSPPGDRASRPIIAWVSAAALVMGALFATPSVLAAVPAAGSLIGSQANASYVDNSGSHQQSTSNLVQTQVQQVGSFNLDGFVSATTTVKNTQAGSSGNLISVSHTVTNTGNGTDGFNIVIAPGPNPGTGMAMSVFIDKNNDGLADSSTALCSAAAGASCTVPTQVLGGAGTATSSFTFLVTYTIPGSATTPTTPFSSGLITVTPAAAGVYSSTGTAYTSPNTTASDVDNINLTFNAAFNATMSLTLPSVSGPGNLAYPAATQSGKHSLASATCPATIAGARSNTVGCVYTTYTLNFNNTGGAVGVFYANSVLPAGLTYVANSAVWSGLGGTALGDGANGDPAGIDFLVTGQTVSMRVAAVNVNTTGSISFMVLVNSTANVGTGTTTGIATYDNIGSTHSTADSLAGTTNTNAAPYTVTATAGVVLGSATGDIINSADTTAGTAKGTFGTADADQNAIVKVTSGGIVRFTHKVFNTGDVTDAFNLSMVNTFPAGSSVTYYSADGATPLLDTNGDGVVDTGNIAAGQSGTFIIQVQIPSVATGTVAYTLTVQAKSFNDATKFDAAGDQVSSVSGTLVDLTNTNPGSGNASVGNGDSGTGPSPMPTLTKSTPAGTAVIFPLFVANNDTSNNTYLLSTSQASSFPGSLPAGWSVKYVTSGTNCTGSVMTSPITVNAGVTQAVDACVTPASTATAGTTSVYFQVSSVTAASTGAIVSDRLQDALTVTTAVTFMSTLTPDNDGQLSAGGTVVYAHTLTNTGAQACGPYTLAVSQSGSATGWTNAIFLDVNGNGQIDAADTPATSGTGLAVGGVAKYLVRVFAPGSATANQIDTAKLTVTYTDPLANCGPHTATDTSKVVTGNIRAVKMQWLNLLCDNTVTPTFSPVQITGATPGSCITYQIVATNEGTAPVTNLVISDVIPQFTTMAAIQPALPCVPSSSVSGSGVAFSMSGTSLSCGTATTVPSSGSLTMQFTVLIPKT